MGDEHDAVVAAARAGDDAAFAELTRRHRRELHVHCYRMLGSFDEAEDLVQETFLRAWRRRESFAGGPGFRAWLYRIATNACLDALRARARRVPALQSMADVPWLTPYPDRLLDEVVSTDAEPDTAAIARETIELAFLAAIQLLPPQQRAVLILRDVLAWTAAETAELLETSVAAANSALQRARATLREHLPQRRLDWTLGAPTEQERAVLARYIDAHERGVDVLSELVREDVRVTMPPQPFCFDGLDALRPLRATAIGMGKWRLVPTGANRQPAAASYLLRPGDTEYRAFKLDVLRVVDGMIAEFTTFGPDLFTAFGLPETLSSTASR